MVTDVMPSLSQRVAQRADEPRDSTLLLDLLMAPFWLLGWTVFWVLVVLGGMGRWCTEAVVLGWVEARAAAQARNVAPRRWPVRPRESKQPRKHGPG